MSRTDRSPDVPDPAEQPPEVRKARRIELGVYIFTAVSLVTLGVFFTSKVLNWIVGPAYVIAMVSLVTPVVLKVAGVADPDAGSYDRWAASADGVAAFARDAAKKAAKAEKSARAKGSAS